MCQSSNPTANVIPGDPKATHCSIASQLHQHFLRLETISDKHARRITGATKVIFLACVASIAVLSVLKDIFRSRTFHPFVLNLGYHVASAGMAFAILAVLLFFWGSSLYRLSVWRREGWALSKRRRMSLTNAYLQAGLTAAILLSWAVNNAHRAADASLFCEGHPALAVYPLIQWTAWNCLLCVILIDAHSLVMRPTAEWPDRQVRDLPWYVHWPKAILWCVAQGITTWGIASEFAGATLEVEKLDGSCEWGDRLRCAAPRIFTIINALWAAVGVLYAALYFVILVRIARQLRVRLYQYHRMQNLGLQILLRFTSIEVVSVTLSLTVLWFVGADTCANFVVTQIGIIPMNISAGAIATVQIFFTHPLIPSDRAAKPNAILQEWAWTLAGARAALDARASGLCPELDASLIHEPMFAFEMACKCFVWASLMYDYTEVPPGWGGGDLPESAHMLNEQIGAAMALFALEKRALFYDRELETKIVVAWNGDTILLAARGTSNAANAWADLKFIQTGIETASEDTCRLHTGFLKSWRTNGISKRVTQHVRQLLDTAQDRAAVDVVCTGHSLGGAIATIAAFEIARDCELAPEQIACYTFGCPRVGNHGFARTYRTYVPDTWHIVNDQDMVVHGLKLFGWYKRNGNRAVVNKHGDCVVRPSLLEISLLQSPFKKSVTNHFLASYNEALLAIVDMNAREVQRGGAREGDVHAGDEEVQGLVAMLRDAHELRGKLAKQAKADKVKLGSRAAYSELDRSSADSASERGGGPAQASGGGKEGSCRWRCPLHCDDKDLPEGARLEGQLLKCGASATMRGCHGGGGGQCSMRRPSRHLSAPRSGHSSVSVNF